MNIKSLMGAAALALATAAPATAVPINLDFAFGGVSGTFYGLDNSVDVSQATSFDLVTPDFEFSGVTGPFVDNTFTFWGGELFFVDFLIADGVSSDNGKAALTALDLFGVSYVGINGDLAIVESGLGNLDHAGRVSFTQTPAPIVPLSAFAVPLSASAVPLQISAVPLPASALLLLSGLAGVAGLKRRKKHTA